MQLPRIEIDPEAFGGNVQAFSRSFQERFLVSPKTKEVPSPLGGFERRESLPFLLRENELLQLGKVLPRAHLLEVDTNGADPSDGKRYAVGRSEKS